MLLGPRHNAELGLSTWTSVAISVKVDDGADETDVGDEANTICDPFEETAGSCGRRYVWNH